MKNKLKVGKGMLEVIKEEGEQVTYTLPPEKELKKIMEECWERTIKDYKGRKLVMYPHRKY